MTALQQRFALKFVLVLKLFLAVKFSGFVIQKFRRQRSHKTESHKRRETENSQIQLTPGREWAGAVAFRETGGVRPANH